MQIAFFNKFEFLIEDLRIKCYKNHIKKNINKLI